MGCMKNTDKPPVILFAYLIYDTFLAFPGIYDKISPIFSIKYLRIGFRGGHTMFSNCSTLIVDDDQFARGIIRHHLTRLGIKNIFEANDGEQALKTLRFARMDLIIADRYMPKLNGLELFCSIQMDPLLKETPFIMITIESDETKIEDALKQGIQHYLVKPFNAETFDNKIQEVLATTQSNY